MVTREQAFEAVLDAYGIVDRKQTLEAFELLARGADAEQVAKAIESLRQGFDLLHELNSRLEYEAYEAEYEAEHGCRPSPGRHFGSGRY